jgi:hypothetical protein
VTEQGDGIGRLLLGGVLTALQRVMILAQGLKVVVTNTLLKFDLVLLRAIIKWSWNRDDLAKHPENDHPKSHVLVFNSDQLPKIPRLDVPVVDRISDVVESLLFWLYLEALVDVTISMARKTLFQCVGRLTHKTWIDNVAVAFGDVDDVQFTTLIQEKLIDLVLLFLLTELR